MPSNIKPTVEIRWSAGDSVLLKHTNNRTFPILSMLGNAKAVPIGQVWVSMPEDATRDIEGNANVYLAGELVNVDAFAISHHSIAKFAENPGSLVISAHCDLPGVDDLHATAQITYGLFLRDPIKLLKQHAHWMEPDGKTQLQAQLDGHIQATAQTALGEGLAIWTSTEISTEAARLFELINDGLLPRGLRLGGAERASKAQFSDFTAQRALPESLYELALQIRVVEFELLEGALTTAIKQTELVARIRQDLDNGRGVGLLDLLAQSSNVINDLVTGLDQAGLGFNRFRLYLKHLSTGNHDLQDGVVHSILKSVLTSNKLVNS